MDAASIEGKFFFYPFNYFFCIWLVYNDVCLLQDFDGSFKMRFLFDFGVM